MITEEQFLSLVSVGRETDSLEAKPGGSRDDVLLRAKVIRAALGMANHEDGGWIVVGIVERADGTFDLEGVTTENVAGWNHDDVSAMINGVADPHVALDVDSVESSGKVFVVIGVHEFVDVPVVCRSHGPSEPGAGQIHKKGACYARSRRKPETIEATSDATTWRTLMDLAANKGAQRFLKVFRGAGLPPQEPAPTDQAKFMAQLKDLR